MTFDRKAYKQATLAALAASRTYNREDALMEMLLNEAEARYNAENKVTVTSNTSPSRKTYPTSESYYYRHNGSISDDDYDIPNNHTEYAPHLKEDLEKVRRNPRLRGTPSDPDNGSYCTACGHYHFGMC
jgi:hypothetical protein